VKRAAIVMAFTLAGCAKLLGLDPTTQVECMVCGTDTCVDLQTDSNHCGDCSTMCNADETCVSGQCASAAPCESGTTEACYTGAANTKGVGPCHGGTRTCTNSHWGACEGEVVPSLDICGDTIDQDCSGAADDPVDADGDGYTTCEGDCCDAPGQGCADPTLVNPGAYDVAGNNYDDDCNAKIDDATTCDMTLASNTALPTELAQAIDLCKTTTDPGKGWGLISATLSLADGTGAPNPNQHSVRPMFGAYTPRAGSQLLVLSNGTAAATGQMNPMFMPFQMGTQFMTMSPYPADWFTANNNKVPVTPGCPAPVANTANDPAMLTLRIRVPVNAKSFRLGVDYMTAEFPEFLCSAYNDEALVLLDSTWKGTPANPLDKNIATYKDASGTHLLDSNLGKTTALFHDCKLPPTQCLVMPQGSCAGDAMLLGTGFETADTTSCSATPTEMGASTGWLVARGNVVGGEVITLRIVIWDSSDQIYDSLALLDDFEWSPDSVTPGTTRE